jgi:hypothetical protein
MIPLKRGKIDNSEKRTRMKKKEKQPPVFYFGVFASGKGKYNFPDKIQLRG